MTYAKATQVAASAGQALALTFGFAGLFTNPMLLFTGLFVWIGASQEACAAQIKASLSGTPASAAMLTNFDTLCCSDTLAAAVRMTLSGSQHDFPVLDRQSVVGILTRTDLLVALADFGHDHPVMSVMRRKFLIAEPAEMLEMALQRLQECDCHTMPVIHSGQLVGLITMDNLGEYLLSEATAKERGGHFGRGKERSSLCSGIATTRGQAY
jgi:CBS-domain-containing membrane protein